MSTPIIIDCDPGHDDAIALLLAIAEPSLDLLAVTTVAGNTTLDKTTANAIRVLDLVGSQIPVAPGADRPLVRDLVVAEYVHGPTGLDGPTLLPPSREPEDIDAIDLIARVLESAPEQVTLVPVGPLTNIALFLDRHPELSDRIERIVLMGGAMGSGNVTPSAEFNIYVDPEAAARVFASGLDITMIGLDVTHHALLWAADADRLAAGGDVGRFVADLFGYFARSEPDARDSGGAPIHDAVAVAHLIWPDLVTTERHPVAIELGDAERGRTVVDLQRARAPEGQTRVATDIDGERFRDLLVDRILSLG